MNIVWILVSLFIGGCVTGMSGRINQRLPKWIALISLTIAAYFLWPLLIQQDLVASTALGVTTIDPYHKSWVSVYSLSWIPKFGINFLLAVDGLSLLLMALTLFLGYIAVLVSWSETQHKVGFFYFNLLWVLAGVVGVFAAMDLFLFFVFWEVMLIPMFFIISIWGHENRYYAAIKFFIYTQASSLLMLMAMLALVFIHYQQSGVMSFSYFELLGTTTDSDMGLWIMLGFFVAFAVKLPSVPFHNWLPDAHTQAPTAGSVILAGILLKTGAYGLIRFIVPLFPEVALEFAPYAMIFGVVSILYGAKLAFAQSDMKRLIAYTSISHMGFIIIGVFAWNMWALQGAVMQMLAHGVSSAALFALAGTLQHRLHTRNMDEMSGLWKTVPRMSAIALFFIIAALGMPGLGNFVGEFLVLLGAFQANSTLTIIAALGLIFAPVYALIVMQKAFHGDENERCINTQDLNKRESLMMGLMVVALVGMGVYPQPIFDVIEPALISLQQYSELPLAVAQQTQ